MATFNQKIMLLKGLLTKERSFTAPFFANIDLTRRCNLHCLGCRYHSTPTPLPSIGDQAVTELPLDMCKHFCRELRQMGTTELIFVSEGENLLYPHLMDIVAYTKELGFRVTLFTNGTLLDDNFSLGFIEHKLDLLKVSFWANSMKEYALNYPGSDPENFNKVILGLKRLEALKKEKRSKYPKVSLHLPINRFNYGHLEERVDLAVEIGCDELSFSCLKPMRDTFLSSLLTPEEEEIVRSSCKKIRERLKGLAIKHNIDEVLLRYKVGSAVSKRLPCYIGWYMTRVKVDGTVLSCCQCDLPMGRLGEQTFCEIWNGPAYRQFRRDTFTRQGLAALEKHCDCAFCCFVRDNNRIHKLLKWISW